MRGSNWPAMKRERETPKRFELLPAALVSGAVGLAVVLVVAAAVVYLESESLMAIRTKRSLFRSAQTRTRRQ